VLLGGLMLASALGVVLTRHPVRSTMCLVVTLFLLAVVFVFLDADFVAALQVVVYAGAILVVFLFVIMLLNLERDQPETHSQGRTFAGLTVGCLLALALLYLLRRSGTDLPGPGMNTAVPTGFGS